MWWPLLEPAGAGLGPLRGREESVPGTSHSAPVSRVPVTHLCGHPDQTGAAPGDRQLRHTYNARRAHWIVGHPFFHFHPQLLA